MRYKIHVTDKGIEELQKIVNSANGQKSWNKVKNDPKRIEMLKKASAKGVAKRKQNRNEANKF